MTPEELKAKFKNPYVLIAIFIGACLWIFASVSALAMSVACFKHSGTHAQHTLGVTIFAFTGPFYWLYYFFNRSYCRSIIGK